MQHTYKVGDRIARESMMMGVTDWRNVGTVIEVVPDADSYYVSFDHLWKSEPVLSNAENMKLISSMTRETLHPNAAATRDWGQIKCRTNNPGKSGDRVWFLRPANVVTKMTSTVSEGYVSEVLSNGARRVIESTTGDMYNVTHDNVREWFKV